MPVNDKNFALLNDKPVPLGEINIDPYLSKLVIYEVLRVMGSRILFIEDHLERLFHSVKLANQQLLKSNSEIAQLLYKLITINNLETGNIKLELFCSDSAVNILARPIPHSYPSENDYARGVSVISVDAERKNPNAKIQNIRLKAEISGLLADSGAWEALLVNQDDFVTEGSRSNFFFIKKDELITPPASQVLTGITRNKLIGLCSQLSVKLTERPVKFDELQSFDSAFLTGTSPKLLPVNAINEFSYDLQNKLMRYLMAAFDKYINDYMLKSVVPEF